ncbi:MAG: hypothetical protein R3C19_24855 [Planctomycetaceae bacterium]
MRFRIFRSGFVIAAVLAAVWCSHMVSAGDMPDAPSYRGLVVGRATLDEVRAALGDSPVETRSPQDLRYPAVGNPALSDRLYFRNSRLELVTAASADPDYPDRATIERTLGVPEAEVLFQTQQYLDYTQRGLKFICRPDGATTGVIYFQPQPRRVPVDHPNARIDLRRQLQAPPRSGVPMQLRVGTAEESIAPERFDDLLPDGKGSLLSLGENLFARVAVFERGERKVVIAGLDVFGLGPWDVQKLRDSLAEKGFPNVIIAMSHTHANVDTIGFYGHYPERYAARILNRTEAAVMNAAANMTGVAGLRLGSSEMPLDGGRVVDLVRNGRDPGVLDPTVNVLQVIGDDGRPIVNVIQLACHPEVIELDKTRALSPDFVGTLCRETSARLGGQSVFLNGALGGMLTPDTRFRTQAAAEEMGRRLTEFVVQAAANSVASESETLSIETRTVEYPVTGESVRTFLENAPGPVEMHDGHVRTEMSVVWIGDAQFITVPGELLPDIGFRVTQKMTGRLRAIIGLANGELGYLVPSFDFRVGGYEERTGPGSAGGEITQAVGLELAVTRPDNLSTGNPE